MTTSPNEAILEPIERASRDEVQALQLQRLQWSVPRWRNQTSAAPTLQRGREQAPAATVGQETASRG